MASRTGLVFQKLGMSRYYTEAGHHVPVTLLQMPETVVVGRRTVDKHGYLAVQLGYGRPKEKRVSKPMKGFFAKQGVAPTRHVVEFRVTEGALLEVGDVLAADHFIVGQYVDAISLTKGKGFAGVMKRHNFGGLEASHGVSISHRSHGSTGQRQDPGKVFKNKKMAGHLGDVRVTVQNLEVVYVDPERGILAVAGAVAGGKNGYVRLVDAVKRALPPGAPYPARVKEKRSVSASSLSSEDSRQASAADGSEGNGASATA